MKQRAFIKALAAGILILCNHYVLGHSAADQEGSLEALVRKADAIVYGTVVDIQYRSSLANKAEPQGIPHTFVTYKIYKILRGQIEKETVTLRIPGGADGKGGVLNISDAPQFSRGQTDILFVDAQKSDNCPLLGCVDGRFRVIDEAIYNGWGVPLASMEERLDFGGKPRFDVNVMDMPRPSFDALLERPDVARWIKEQGIKDLNELRQKYEHEAPKIQTVNLAVDEEWLKDDYFPEGEARPVKEYGSPVQLDVFLEHIYKLNYHLGDTNYLLQSADINARFEIAPPRPEVFKVTDNDVEISDEEAEELRREKEVPDSTTPNFGHLQRDKLDQISPTISTSTASTLSTGLKR